MRFPDLLNPERLWILILLPLLIILYIIGIKARINKGLRYSNALLLGKVLGKQSLWMRHLAVALSLCSLVLLTVAWANPLGIEKVAKERATFILILDNSLSMEAKDISPNRFEAAKKAAIEFVEKTPKKFNISIISLSGKPSIKMPPSADHEAVKLAISGLKLEDGTAIGAALEEAFEAAKQAPSGQDKTLAPASIILLSDGTNTVGKDPVALADIAKSKKMPIYTIAYGSDNGYVDLDNKRYNVAPDRKLLKELANRSGGEFLEVRSAGKLKEIYNKIGSAIGYEKVKRPITTEYALASLGFAILASLGATMMAARWP